MELSSGYGAATLNLDNKPPWLAPALERTACARTWSVHFQPLLREISHILTCVPGELPYEQHGGWDQRTYCKTLAGLVAFFEHHACWATLSALLRHSGQFGMALCYRGQRVADPTSATLQALLQGAKHEDVTVQYFPPEKRQPRQSWFQQKQGLSWRWDDDMCSLPSDEKNEEDEELSWSSSSNASSRNSNVHNKNSKSDESASTGVEAMTTNISGSKEKDMLASEFQGWKQQWLALSFTSSDIKKAAYSFVQAAASPLSSSSETWDKGSGANAPMLSICPLPMLDVSTSVQASNKSDIRRDLLMVVAACICVIIFSAFL